MAGFRWTGAVFDLYGRRANYCLQNRTASFDRSLEQPSTCRRWLWVCPATSPLRNC
jgi:hypothetical protein